MRSRYFHYRALVPLALSAALVLGQPGLPAFSQGEDTPPPVPPVQYDPSCDDLDEYWFAEFSPHYDYYADGKWMDAGKKYSTGGATVVTIQARDMYRNVAQTWEFMFETTDCDFTEATDTYSVQWGECHYRSGRTDLFASVVNTDDATDRYRRSIAVYTERSDGWGPSYAYDVSKRILDGETRRVAIGEYDGDGMPPGTYTMKFYRDGKFKTPVATRTIFVPSCGTSDPPPGDPGLAAANKKPRGTLLQIEGKVRARAINRGVPTKSQFKIVAKALSGEIITRSQFAVLPSKVVTKYLKRRPKTLYVLSARYKVDGRLKWHVVARKTIR